MTIQRHFWSLILKPGIILYPPMDATCSLTTLCKPFNTNKSLCCIRIERAVKSNLGHMLPEVSWEWHFCPIFHLCGYIKTKLTLSSFSVATGTHSSCIVSYGLPNDCYQCTRLMLFFGLPMIPLYLFSCLSPVLWVPLPSTMSGKIQWSGTLEGSSVSDCLSPSQLYPESYFPG